MAVPISRPMQHNQVGFYQSTLIRAPSPYFAPPMLTGMREPGTNFISLITAHEQGGPGSRIT